MISLKRSMHEYDRAQALVSGLRTTLASSLEAAQQYAVPADPAGVEEFRSQLKNIALGIEHCLAEFDDTHLASTGAVIRGAWKVYYESASRYLDELRASVSSTSDVLREMIATLRADDSDGEKLLKAEISRLQSVDQLTNLDEVRSCVRRSVTSLTSCLDQLRHEKDVVIAQLRDEIRALQKNMEEQQRTSTSDAATGACRREEFEKLLRREIVRGQPATVVRLRLENLAAVAARNPIDQILAAFRKRVQEVVPSDVMGRWHDNVFCVLIPSARARAAATALAAKCAGVYAYMDGKAPRTLQLRVAVACLSCAGDADVDEFFKEIDNPRAGT